MQAVYHVVQRPAASARLAYRRAREAHLLERQQRAEIAEAVGEEAERFAEGVNDEAADRRSYHARGVEERRVQRDGVADVLAPVHHVRDERVARRHLEGVEQPARQDERENYLIGNQIGEGQKSEGEGDAHTARLRAEDELAQVEPLDDRARERRKEENRQRGDEVHQPERAVRIREAEDEPAYRDAIHPQPRHRNHLGREEKPVVARVQRAQRLRETHLRPRALWRRTAARRGGKIYLC